MLDLNTFIKAVQLQDLNFIENHLFFTQYCPLELLQIIFQLLIKKQKITSIQKIFNLLPKDKIEKNVNFKTVLFQCIDTQNHSFIQNMLILLKNFNFDINHKNEQGNNALHYYILKNKKNFHFEIFDFFLSSQINFFEQNFIGHNFIHLLILNNYYIEDNILGFIEENPNILKQKNYFGLSVEDIVYSMSLNDDWQFFENNKKLLKIIQKFKS